MRRVLVSGKVDPEIAKYIEGEAQIENWSESVVIADMLGTQVEMEQVLGEQWWEIEAEAVRQRTTKGKVLAQLVLAALKKR